MEDQQVMPKDKLFDKLLQHSPTPQHLNQLTRLLVTWGSSQKENTPTVSTAELWASLVKQLIERKEWRILREIESQAHSDLTKQVGIQLINQSINQSIKSMYYFDSYFFIF